MSDLRAIILAAGKGTRMRSKTLKVLHPVCGKPVIEYILSITRRLGSLKTYLVIGHAAGQVKKTVGEGVTYVLQDKQLGTAHAVKSCAPFLKGFKGTVLVLCGDTPLLSVKIVRALLAEHKKAKASATVLTAVLDNPRGYGRMVRDGAGRLTAIREQKDATAAEGKVREINAGAYCFQAADLFEALNKVRKSLRKKEFYLTDVIEDLLARRKRVATLMTEDETAVLGINTREDLAQAEAVMRRRILSKHMHNGVTLIDPLTTYIEDDVRIGRDTVIHPCTFIQSDVRIGVECVIGPVARLRSGTRIGDRTQIGNFAEISRAEIGKDVFMKHFSFVGDASVGNRVNIGAGTVTANFDGKQKNRTSIAEGAFIGSDAVLVAPVVIGKGAVVGAGSVVTRGKTVPAGAVAVGVPARVIQRSRHS